MKILSFAGNKKIISSETVIIEKKDDLVLEIDSETGFNFVVRFILNVESKENEINLETKPVSVDSDVKEIRIIKSGKVSEFGVGPGKLIELGKINNKKLFIYFVIYKLFQGQFYKIEYTFYEE